MLTPLNPRQALLGGLVTLFIALYDGPLAAQGADLPPFSAADVFDLEYADDPVISPDGKTVVYVRASLNALTDGTDRRLWTVDVATGAHRKLTVHEANESSPAFSPSGDRLAYVLATDDGAEVYVRWLATGQTARLSALPHSPRGLRWSPDGELLAFSMQVDADERDADFALSMPAKPDGAEWADKPRVTTRLRHEADGRGYLDPGYGQLFTLPAEGGTARQLTGGAYDHGADFAWVDGERIVLSANRRPDAEYEFRDDDLYLLTLADTSIARLTEGYGPDYGVAVSPDGETVAFLGHEDLKRAYQRDRIRLLALASGEVRELTADWDRDPTRLEFAPDGRSLYAAYTEAGLTKLARVDLGSGEVTEVLDDLGGTSLGRPYTSGTYALAAETGAIAYTQSRPHRPADLAVLPPGGDSQRLTALNEDLLAYRRLGEVREVDYPSVGAEPDGEPLTIQGWVVLPPDYDSTRRYPLIVENHGGPILAYGPHFTAEIQLMAAHGYVVFYPNPRGSTGYGEGFSDLLYRNYPGEDYDDVIAGVDHVVDLGIAHPDSLYVTGGSAGGIMTAWIVGKTDRFRAAVVAKPVVNWISKTLVADNYFGYANSRYEGQPYENPMHYWAFSPLSLVTEVETPTMVMVGTDDLRTPPSEAKQLYHALKLEGVSTALVELPGASHGIARRPSQLVQKVMYTLGWFERYR